MVESISDKIRKIAALIERDNTPSDGIIWDRIMIGIPPGDRCKKEEERQQGKKKKIVAPVRVPDVEPTASPERRRPRRQPAHKNKWNDDSKAGLMKDYMQRYRADGKDKEVNGPKSTYHKKL